jgi:hypothetical protein
MRGVSDVIAMLLMLVITVGLVGLAYSYISGIFSSRTSVILVQESKGECVAGATFSSLIFWIRNDGSQRATNLFWQNVPTNPSTVTACSFDSQAIDPGRFVTVNCTRNNTISGYYKVRIGAAGTSPTTATIYCSG